MLRGGKRKSRGRPRKKKQSKIIRQLIKGNLHNFTRSYAESTLTATGGLGYIFQLSRVPNVGEFSSLFDYYKIYKVQITYVPQANVAQAGVTGANIPLIHYRVDLDDATAPASEIEMLEDSRTKSMYLDKKKTITIFPKVTNEVFNTGVTTQYALVKDNPFLDMALTTTEHYGFKIWIVNISANYSIRTYVKVFFSCRGVR